MKTTTVKPALKYTLTTMALTILAFAFSGCESTGGGHGGGDEPRWQHGVLE